MTHTLLDHLRSTAAVARVMAALEKVKAYDPSQPRAPEGSAKGGQWVSTNGIGSAAFKAWFGDSKVVDEDGAPLVVYKGMYPYDHTRETATDPGPAVTSIHRTSEFPAFNGDEPGVRIAGFFGDKETANRFAQSRSSVFPVYLSIENPYTIDAKGAPAGTTQFGPSGLAFRDAIRSGKYDGVIIRNTKDEGTIYVAIKPTQIKSAIGNAGTFSPDDPDIAKAKGFDPSKHPRHEKGKAEGGQFKPKDGGYSKSMSDWMAGLTPWWMKPDKKDFVEQAPPKGSAQHTKTNDKGQPVTIYKPTPPTPESTWHNADEVASWSPGTPAPPVLNGVTMSSWSPPEDWASVEGQLDLDEPPLDLPKGKHAGAGVVIEEPDGRVWLVKPTNGYGGYINTIPKGTQEPGLSLQATAIKETWEESGLKVRIKGVLGDIERDTSTARIYVAERTGGTPTDMGWESQAVRLVPKKLLKKFLNRSADHETFDAYMDVSHLYKAYNANQPRWPAGTPLGGQWMDMDGAGLPTPPKIAGEANPGYQKTAMALYDAAQKGDKKTIADFIESLKAKIEAGGAKSWHSKQHAKNVQYAEHLLSSMDKQTQATASAAKITGPQSIADWQVVAPKPGGSAKGGGAVMVDPDGNQWLVKGYKNDGMAQNEVLAAQLYNAAIPGSAPEMQVVKLGDQFGGGLGVASKWIESSALNKTDPKAVGAAQKGFAADAWLANWDTVGLEYDNIRIDAEGNAVRVDPGGSLLYRAMGTPKGPLFGDTVGEIHTLRDPKMNPTSAAIFGKMTESEIADSIKSVAAVEDQTIRKLVDAYGPGDKEAKNELADKLINRRDHLAAMGANMKPPEAPPVVLPVKTSHGGVDYPTHHGDKFTATQFDNKVANIEAIFTEDSDTATKVETLKQWASYYGNESTKDNAALSAYAKALHDKLDPPKSWAHSIMPGYVKSSLVSETVHANVVEGMQKLHETGDMEALKQHAMNLSNVQGEQAKDPNVGPVKTYVNALVNDLQAKADSAPKATPQFSVQPKVAASAAGVVKPAFKIGGGLSQSTFDTQIALVESLHGGENKAGLQKLAEAGWQSENGKSVAAYAKAHVDLMGSGKTVPASHEPNNLVVPAPPVHVEGGGVGKSTFNNAIALIDTTAAANNSTYLKELATNWTNSAGDSELGGQNNKALGLYAKQMAGYVEAKGGKEEIAREPTLKEPTPPAYKATGTHSGPLHTSQTHANGIDHIKAIASEPNLSAETKVKALKTVADNWANNSGLGATKNPNGKALAIYAEKMADYVEAKGAGAVSTPTPAVIGEPKAPTFAHSSTPGMTESQFNGAVKAMKATADKGHYSTLAQTAKSWQDVAPAKGSNAAALGDYAMALSQYVKTKSDPGAAGEAAAAAEGINFDEPPDVTGTTSVKPALPDFEKYKTKSEANKVSHNGKIDAIAALAKEGNVNGILALSYGAKQSYSKTQTIAANDALAALGSPHKVVMGQKKGQHPALGGETSSVAISARAANDLVEAKQKGGKFDASKLPEPPNFNNWGNSGKGLSSNAAYNTANQSHVDALYAVAKKGSIAALQAHPIPETQTSKHIGLYKEALINQIDAMLNPPEPLKVLKHYDALSQLKAEYPVGTNFSTIPSSKAAGYWLALGTGPSPIGKWVDQDLDVSSSWISKAKQAWSNASSLSRSGMNAQQASSAFANAYRKGDSEYGSMDLQAVYKAWQKDAVEVEAEKKLYRYVNMDSAMINKMLSLPKGAVVADLSPQAFSYANGATKSFGDHKLEMVVLPGVRMMPSFGSGKHSHEREVTGLPGQRFIILKVRKRKDGSLKIKGALLPAHW